MTSLTSNGTPIPFTSKYFGKLRESDFVTLDDTALCSRYAGDGYVLLRNAVPAEAVWKVREAYLARFGRSACTDGDVRSELFSGVAPVGLPNYGTKGHPAYDFVRSDTFRAFTRLDVFRRLAETLFGSPADLIQRTPLRHFIFGRKLASRAHIDKTYIDIVADDLVTIWVPLGDCPIEAGGLLYLEGSHRDPDLKERLRDKAPTDRTDDFRPLTNDLKWLSDMTGRRWLSANYRAGDVMVHSPFIVHASTDPQVEMMRLSTDIRFRRRGSYCDPRWNNDWSADDGH